MLRNFLFRLIIPLLIVAGVIGAGGLWYYDRALNTPIVLEKGIFTIKKGDTITGIANRFVAEGKLREPWTMKLLARKEFSGKSIQAGEYELPTSLKMREFLDRIVSGRGQVDMRITVVEGWNFRQMREVLNKAPKLRNVTADWPDEQIMETLGYPDLHPEGQFYPDTYYYRADDPDLIVFRKSFNLMQEILAAAWEQRDAEALEIDTPYEALILASIIEKETQVRDEQPTIAGVFMNRLRKGMRLQTDPTVIYGIGESYDGNITKKHLKTDTPYNTYTREGLTPTPISLPGEDSLIAAVRPAETKAFYFVASAKGDGSHTFSRTLSEHNKAVRAYLRARKKK